MRKRTQGLKSYFTKHHYGYSNSVNTDLARYKLSRLFEELNEDSDLGAFIGKLALNLKSLHTINRSYLKHDNDTRSGFESYGYGSIATDLIYVSDRYNCAFRSRWLIDLVNLVDYKTLLKEQKQP